MRTSTLSQSIFSGCAITAHAKYFRASLQVDGASPQSEQKMTLRICQYAIFELWFEWAGGGVPTV
jgi:hypothetical protein